MPKKLRKESLHPDLPPAAGGKRDQEYPEDGELRKWAGPKRQRAVKSGTLKRVRKGPKPYNPDAYEHLDVVHPDLFKGGYAPEKKIQAVACYMICGTFAEASRMCGIDGATIAGWKKNSEWWPALVTQINRNRQEELDIAFTQAIHKSTEVTTERLTNGDVIYDKKTESFIRQPVKGKDAAVIAEIMFRNRALQRGDPTQRVEKMNRIGQQFDQFSKAKDVTDLTEITIHDQVKDDASDDSTDI